MNPRDWISQTRAAAGILHGGRVFGGPLHVYLHITNRCNIRCVFCPFFSPHIEKPILSELRRARLNGVELRDDQYEKDLQKHHGTADADSEKTSAIIDELLRMGSRQFTFAGNGEPFLHRNIMEFIGRAMRGRSACVAFTNGTLLDHSTIDALIRMGFNELRISLMAGTEEMYQRTHPGIRKGTFDKIRDNLLYLSERKKAAGSGRPIVTLINVVFSENAEGIVDFIEFAAAVGADRIKFNPFNNYNDPALSALVPTQEQTAFVKKQLTASKAYIESRKIHHNIDYFLSVFRNRMDSMGLYRDIPCYIGWLGVRLNPDGRVYPCCGCNSHLGNAYETGFGKIWEGEEYRKFRREALQLQVRGTPPDGCSCRTCAHYTLNLRVHKFFHPLKGRSLQHRFEENQV